MATAVWETVRTDREQRSVLESGAPVSSLKTSEFRQQSDDNELQFLMAVPIRIRDLSR
jgi:hypothetical protein